MATYRPDPTGAWIAAVRGRVALFAPATAAVEVAAVWPEFGAPDPTSRVLDRLTASGLSATPPFALVVRDADGGSARVVARGAVRVIAGETTVSGEGVSTWAERLIAASDGELRLESTDSAPDDAPELPLVEGVVYAVAVTSIGTEPVANASAPVGPAVAATPAPVTPASIPAPAPAPVALPAEQTMVPIEDTIASPVRSAPLARPTPTPPGDLEGDHDGLTVASIDLRRLRAERAVRPVPPTPVSGVTVAPSSSLRMPDGSLEAIGHEVVLGRAPSVSQVSGGRIPRLITIGAGDPDISRNHLRVAVEGDTVVVTDLHSRNGTHVVAPGKPPVKLRSGEPTPVLAGTVMDLGGGWTIQVVGE
jgi:hypothetical protein